MQGPCRCLNSRELHVTFMIPRGTHMVVMGGGVQESCTPLALRYETWVREI